MLDEVTSTRVSFTPVLVDIYMVDLIQRVYMGYSLKLGTTYLVSMLWVLDNYLFPLLI